jgi:hypothetical protein
MQVSADDLAQDAQKLRTEVANFIATVKAA